MDIFKDPILFHKNFKMGKELDIAGEFIYTGISKLEQMEDLDNQTDVFYFLYHISIGIERLQKVLIILLEKFDIEKLEEFEKSLITHNHEKLQKKIKHTLQLELNPLENSFLQLLDRFYNTSRYNRFNTLGAIDSETTALAHFIIEKFEARYEENIFRKEHLVISDKIKERLGRIIGSISNKYFSLIKTYASKQNLYTYEISYDSNAYKIFNVRYKKQSLHEMKLNEKISVKELLIYLVNSKDSNSIMKLIKNIEPLDFDETEINDFLKELLNGHITLSLLDCVETNYEEDIENINERINLLSPIANPNTIFPDEDDY
ncbi:hypothetical protein [Listeria grandensis]|uniref:hypothetical protein n=1 Tax=Listeria grandensis TaxID=1494963 RepID=UPI00164DE8A4|nr:hypothetical protein [Listeria grandensis]MBC6314051.1 hypothetical protein [Listeria grandensis]